MSVQALFTTANYIASITQLVNSKGMSLELGTDFSEFCSVPGHQPEKGHIAPIFDPTKSDISSDNGFWVVGRNDSNEIVHTQAARLVDLRGTTLCQHFKDRLGDYRPHGDTVDPSLSMSHLTPEAGAITGRMVYYGELWMKGGEQGFRGGSLTALLPRLMFALSLLHLKPDYLIGIMEPLAACKGLSAREGYTHLEQGSFHWHQTEQDVPLEEWFVWMTAQDVIFNMRVAPETLDSLYAQKPADRAPQLLDKAA